MVTGTTPASFDFDVVVVGGGGHVGLPLAIAFADRGLKVGIYDVNDVAVKTVLAGELPFMENGATEVLQRVLAAGRLDATTDPSVVSRGEHLVVVIGTPVDEHLNPDPHAVPRALDECRHYFRPGQLLVLRSTVYPGVTRRVEKMLAEQDLGGRRGVLPGADRRGQGDGGAVLAARRSSRPAPRRCVSGPARCSAT